MWQRIKHGFVAILQNQPAQWADRYDLKVAPIGKSYVSVHSVAIYVSDRRLIKGYDMLVNMNTYLYSTFGKYTNPLIILNKNTKLILFDVRRCSDISFLYIISNGNLWLAQYKNYSSIFFLNYLLRNVAHF